MDPNKIIDSLGGTSAVAVLCKIKPASVSEWRTKGIPPARLQFFQVIRPDLFDAEPEQQPTEPVTPDHRHTLRRLTDIAPPADPLTGTTIKTLKHHGAA